MGNASSRGFAHGRPTCAPRARTLEVRATGVANPLKQYPPSPAGYGGTSVTAVVDGSGGDVVERYAYDPYGRVTVLDGEDDADGGGVSEWSADADNVSDWDNRIGYCGYRLDPETGADGQGIMHVRHRPYMPPLGRWISRDPLNQDRVGGGYHDGMNLIGYEGPSVVEPSGLARCNLNFMDDSYAPTAHEFDDENGYDEARLDLKKHGVWSLAHNKNVEGRACYNTWTSKCRYVIVSETPWRYVEAAIQKIIGRPDWHTDVDTMLSIADKVSEVALKAPIVPKCAKTATDTFAWGMMLRYAKRVTIKTHDCDCDKWVFSRSGCWRLERTHEEKVVIERHVWITDEPGVQFPIADNDHYRQLWGKAKEHLKANDGEGKRGDRLGLPGDPRPDTEE